MGKPKTKICKECGQSKRLREFEETHKGSGVYLKVCKVCRNTKRNEAYDSTVQEYIDHTHRVRPDWTDSLREWDTPSNPMTWFDDEIVQLPTKAHTRLEAGRPRLYPFRMWFKPFEPMYIPKRDIVMPCSHPLDMIPLPPMQLYLIKAAPPFHALGEGIGYIVIPIPEQLGALYYELFDILNDQSEAKEDRWLRFWRKCQHNSIDGNGWQIEDRVSPLMWPTEGSKFVSQAKEPVMTMVDWKAESERIGYNIPCAPARYVKNSPTLRSGDLSLQLSRREHKARRAIVADLGFSVQYNDIPHWSVREEAADIPNHDHWLKGVKCGYWDNLQEFKEWSFQTGCAGSASGSDDLGEETGLDGDELNLTRHDHRNTGLERDDSNSCSGLYTDNDTASLGSSQMMAGSMPAWTEINKPGQMINREKMVLSFVMKYGGTTASEMLEMWQVDPEFDWWPMPSKDALNDTITTLIEEGRLKSRPMRSFNGLASKGHRRASKETRLLQVV